MFLRYSFVGPEPPIPKSIFISSLLILNFFEFSDISKSLICISGSSLHLNQIYLLINFFGTSTICC